MKKYALYQAICWANRDGDLYELDPDKPDSDSWRLFETGVNDFIKDVAEDDPDVMVLGSPTVMMFADGKLLVVQAIFYNSP